MNYSLFIASDHAGFALKSEIINQFASDGILFTDLGPFSEASVDYPDFAHPLAKAVTTVPNAMGIALCGSGNGICMTVNKTLGVRAALCWDIPLAALARQHNDANVMCLPARFLEKEKAIEMVKVFIETSFEGGRHAARVSKIDT